MGRRREGERRDLGGRVGERAACYSGAVLELQTVSSNDCVEPAPRPFTNAIAL